MTIALTNLARTPEYIKLLHSIRSCNDAKQLSTLRDSALSHYKSNKDEKEILADYLERETELNPEWS